MSLRKDTPCDLDGICPYESGEYCSCEYWCGADEPKDCPDAWECGVDDCPEAEPDFWMSSTESPDTYLSTSGEVRHFRSRLSQEESATS